MLAFKKLFYKIVIHFFDYTKSIFSESLIFAIHVAPYLQALRIGVFNIKNYVAEISAKSRIIQY